MKTHHIGLTNATLLFLMTIFAFTIDSFAETQKLYMPILQATNTADLGLALCNPTLSDATVILTAHGLDGKAIAGQDITNPVSLIVPASGQRALRAAEIFGPGISGKTGWVELESSTPAVKGFFLLFDAGLTFIDGAELATASATRLIFPRVSVTQDSATNIVVINTAASGLEPAITLYDNTGHLVARDVIGLEPFGGFSGSITSLVRVDAGFDGYAVIDAASTPFSSMPASLVGFETYRNQSDIALISGLPESAMLRSGFITHFASQGGFQTRLTLVNHSAQAQVVKITADGLKAGAQFRTPTSATAERTIPANGRLQESDEQLFSLTGEALIVGSLHFEVQGDTRGLIGYADFGTTDGVLLSAIQAQGAGFSDLYFSHIAEGAGFYTGMAFLNPNTQSSWVTLDVFDREGRRVDSTVFALAAGERRSQLVSELLPSVANQLGGFVHVTASRPILANQMFGSRGKLTFLANVAPQGVPLRPQGNGRMVIAAAGANVIASDGSASVAISPVALAADTAIRLVPVAVSTLPDPSATRKIVAAIDAQPAGTRFNIPVKLSFPLAVQLAPGSRVPLLILNPTNNAFDDSDLSAIVDDSGRKVWADITRCATYAVALPSDQLIAVTTVSPDIGMPGITITVTGAGFSTDAAKNIITFAGPDNVPIKAAASSATATSMTVTVPAGVVTGHLIVQEENRSSLGITFTVPLDNPKPAIASISPTIVSFGAASAPIEISGNSFQPNSTATYDGANSATTFVDSTLLLMTVSGSQLNPGVHKIVVSNPAPAGGNSNTGEFTVAYPVPVLSSLSPASISQGTQAEVTINGSGFTSSSIVLVDGTPASGTFLSGTSMKVALAGPAIGKRSIAVSNPAPGGGISNTVTLEIAVPSTQPPVTPPSPPPPVTPPSPPSPVTPPSAPSLSISPANVAVQITSSTAVGAYDVTITFDKSVVNCSPNNVTGGNAPGFTDRPTTVNCQNADGTLRLNHFQSGNSPAGTLTVANVTLIPVAAGTTNLSVNVNALTDTSGLSNLSSPAANVTLSAGSVTVTRH